MVRGRAGGHHPHPSPGGAGAGAVTVIVTCAVLQQQLGEEVVGQVHGGEGRLQA